MADTTPGAGGRSSRPARQLRPSRGRRLGDAIMSLFVRAGLVSSAYLLTTRGRKSGRPLRHPATVVEHDGRRWLVAPSGPVLKRDVGVATAARPSFQADKDAPVEDLVAEADRHPVFELLPLDPLASDHG